MKFLLLFILTMTFAEANTKLLLIGGGPRPTEAMKAFVTEAGGSDAYIVIIPWASDSIEGAQNIRSELLSYSPRQVNIFTATPLSNLEKKQFRSELDKATGIFFTGGDQNILMKRIAKLNLKNTFREMFFKGIIFAGTSAGTAVMCDPMLSGQSDLRVIDPSKTELVEGLGLLPKGVVVDQHFILRQRFNRLASLILQGPFHHGLGIDEGASILIKDKDYKVIGPKDVLIFKKTADHQMLLQLFKNGQRSRLP